MIVKIKGYQAIEDATLEFVEGINVIVGPTNSGKSSIIRAIEGAINNQSGKNFINYDSDKSVVSILDNDNEIIWTKTKKGVSTYTINDREISKIGTTQNEEVAKLLNMEEIEVANSKVRLNFWKQMDKAFLMDKTQYQLFEFISQSKEQDIINSKRADTLVDVKSINDLINSLNIEIDLLKSNNNLIQENINKFSICNSIDIETIESLEKAKELLVSKLDSYTTTINSLSTIVSKHSVLTPIIDDLEQILDKMQDSKDKLELKDKLDKYNTLDNNLENLKNNLSNQPDIEDLKDKLDNLGKTIEIINDKQKFILDLKDTLNRYNNLNKDIETITNKKGLLDIELDKLSKDLKEFKVCPFCGAELEKEECFDDRLAS